MRVQLLSRAAPTWLIYVVLAVFMTLFLTPAVRGWDVPKLAAGYVALGVLTLLGAPFLNLWRVRKSDSYSDLRSVVPWFYALWSGIAVWLTLLITGASLPGGGASELAVAGVALVAMYRLTSSVRASAMARPLRVRDPDHAMELAVYCDERLTADMRAEEQPEIADGRLTPDARAVLRLSFCNALLALSARADQEDLVPVAVTVLDEIFEDDLPEYWLDITILLVEAMEIKWDRTGDSIGYEESLDALMEAAEAVSAEDPDAMRRAYAARGMSHARRSRRASEEGNAELADLRRWQATQDFKRALALVPSGTQEHALYTLELARTEGPDPFEGSLDDAIKQCRSALRQLWIMRFEERAPGYLALAELLELRAVLQPNGGLSAALERLWPTRPRSGAIAWLWPDRRTHDLARALRLCMKVGVNGEYAQQARRRIPNLQALLGERIGVAWQSGWMYKRLIAGEVEASPGGAIEVASKWADWAMRRGDAHQAAEAWMAWMTAVSADLRRRVQHDKSRRLPQIQQLVAVAAYWMVKAGRPRDAAVTLDLGRAVLLTERIQRQTQLAERLERAGHGELARRWREAEEDLRAEDRASFGTGDPQEAAAFGSIEYLALLEHESLLQEIAALEGFDDVDRAPSFKDLSAAAVDGPIVYLATVQETGFALVVTRGADDPVAVELPELDRERVQAHVARVREAAATSTTALVMRTLLPQLWAAAFEPLLAHLPAPALVTVIATGPLGELPLHAAGTAPDANELWQDRVGGLVFRYAPNARLLGRSQRMVRRFPATGMRVVTAAVPETPEQRRLTHALAESEHVAAAFGEQAAERPVPATVSAITQRLEQCAVWHFACHGSHDPEAPLNSRLELADGPLSLGAMFSRPSSRGRLAVLSACQTAHVGALAPDEVIGFPSAMLQSGVAGVVSCQGDVDDAAAMLLVLRFFGDFIRTLDPARSLAGAQAWLRTGTNADFHAAFPHAYPRPHEAPDGWDDDHRFAAPSTWALFNYTGA